jgi:DNA-binding NarL/FixJ family response regulator
MPVSTTTRGRPMSRDRDMGRFAFCKDGNHRRPEVGFGRSMVGLRYRLSTLEMPGTMNGLEFCTAIERRFPQLKFLVTSGRISAEEAMFVGSFILKPYDPADVVARIRALAEQRPE